VRAFRFVDDLFLGGRRVIETMMAAFSADRVSDWAVWDATGRINVRNRASDATLDVLAGNGLREVALSIESGSERVLTLIDKRIDPGMTHAVVRRLTERGINVKGYFILGFPTETRDEIDTTVTLPEELIDYPAAGIAAYRGDVSFSIHGWIPQPIPSTHPADTPAAGAPTKWPTTPQLSRPSSASGPPPPPR
jgi:radical SAM superfamily enzyme YgiQ (UPF0313 family)